jgi:hypothetical protein
MNAERERELGSIALTIQALLPYKLQTNHLVGRGPIPQGENPFESQRVIGFAPRLLSDRSFNKPQRGA